MLTNDEWFILLLLFGTQNYNAQHVLQRIKADIVFCQTVFDRYVDIHVMSGVARAHGPEHHLTQLNRH